MKKWLTGLFCLATLSLSAAGEIKDSGTGATFPASVSFEHDGKQYQLDATGTSTRKKLIVKVYGMASYLEKGAAGADSFAKVMDPKVAKQLTMKWMRDIEAKQLTDGYRDSFKIAVESTNAGDIQKEIDQFLGFYTQPIKNGDEQVLRYAPGGYVELLINGKSLGNITSEPFAQALWAIWFGPKSVVNRDQLVSLMK